jgi:hypothetical protein
MPTLGEVRTALAAQIADALPWLNVYRLPADSISAPAVIIGGLTIDLLTADGNMQIGVDIHCAVSRRNVDEVDTLDRLAHPNDDQSVWAVLEADPTLGGVVNDCLVTRVDHYREAQYGDIGYYASTISTTVLI